MCLKVPNCVRLFQESKIPNAAKAARAEQRAMRTKELKINCSCLFFTRTLQLRD